MDYNKHYDALISRAKGRTLTGYKERHHIVPRCMGGSNDRNNIADLTPEEHYLAHLLLLKIHGTSVNGLLFAISRMSGGNKSEGPRARNKFYGWCKRKLAVAKSAHSTAYFSIAKNRQAARQRTLDYIRKNPDKVAQHKRRHAEAVSSPNYRTKLSSRTAEFHRNNPNVASAHSAYMKRLWSDPSMKKVLSDGQIRRFEKDDQRKLNTGRVREYFTSSEWVSKKLEIKGKEWLMEDGSRVAATTKDLVRMFPNLHLSESGLNRVFRGEYSSYKGIRCLGRYNK